MINFWNDALRRVRQLPGVEAAGFATILPLSGSNSDSSFSIEGRFVGKNEPGPDEEIRIVTLDYFPVLKTPLLSGRLFDETDNAHAPGVVITNEALAKKYWPNEEALGKRITFSNPRKPDPKWLTIVGIVRSVRHRGLDLDPAPEYYLPLAQRAESSMILTVRSAQDPGTLTSAIRREIQSIDPDQPIANVRTLETVTADSIAPRRMSMVLLGAFAGVALLLASVGIYGVISYLVVQRTHEIGVRMALGAQRSDVLRLVVGHAAKLVGIGTAIGLILAFFSTRTLSALLYNVGAFDAGTFVFVTIALIGLGQKGDTRRAFSAIVTSNYFSVLGVPLARGRAFLPEEETLGDNAPVAIVSYSYWQKHDLDPGLLGSQVIINGRPFTIVGIAPKGFVGTMQILSPEVWLPMSVYDQVANDFESDNKTTINDRKGTQVRIMGRLKPGTTAAVAKPALEGLAANLEKAYPVEQKDQTFMAAPVSRNSVSNNPAAENGIT